MKKNVFATAMIAISVMLSCSKEQCTRQHLEKPSGLPVVLADSWPGESISMNPGETLEIHPEVISGSPIRYKWYLNGENVSTTEGFTFSASSPSRMLLELELENEAGTVSLSGRINVSGEMGEGFYIINEGWFGHDNGSVSFYNTENNTIRHNAFAENNYGESLGITSQSATLWNGKMYICSKQDNTLAVVDPNTLYATKVTGHLAGSLQTYEMIGIDNDYAILTHNGYFSRIDLNTYETKTYMMVGNTWGGTGSGTMFGGRLILNVNGDNLYAIDPAELSADTPTFSRIDVFTSGGTRFVECSDGYLYTIESKKDGTRNLARIDRNLNVEKKAIREDYNPSSFSTYTEDSFCGTPDGDFYYIAGGRIYHATWEDPAPEEAFTAAEPGMMLYGAGIRVNPSNGELVATYVSTGEESGTEIYNGNLVARYDGSTGEKVGECRNSGYFFPATVIFR